MTLLEIDIQTIEAQIKALSDTLQIVGSNTPAGQTIQQQIDGYTVQLQAKKQLLASQQQETVYEHLSRIVPYSPELYI